MRLLIIADDFTGALDVAVQFAAYDVTIKVAIGQSIDVSDLNDSSVDVLVIDAETRHLSQDEVVAAIGKLVRLYQSTEAEILYMKMDSALRGNVGATLTTALAESGYSFLSLAPAFPDMQRFTRNGVQYDGDTLIHQSSFGSDPFAPVRTSTIAELFSGWDVLLHHYPRAKAYTLDNTSPVIGIFDVEDISDFKHIAEQLKRDGKLNLLAGSAAFASVLPGYLDIQPRTDHCPLPQAPLLVLCGSLNPITRRQLQTAAANGFACVTLPSATDDQNDLQFANTLQTILDGKTNVILQTEEIDFHTMKVSAASDKQAVSQATADRIGNLLKHLYNQGVAWEYLPMIIGGDTLAGVMRQLSAPDITMERELEAGVVLFSVTIADKHTSMISKSGGFGDATLLLRIAQATEKKGH